MKSPMSCSVLLTVFLSALLGSWAPAQADVPPAVGTMAPAFKLQDQTGQWHSLDEYKGKWVALYFYPKDGTPGCTTEACEFRDNVFAFRDANAVIVGISLDEVASHRRFATENNLPFTLLADPTKSTAKAYGVLTKLMGLMDAAQRDTFVIDPAGRIVKHYVRVDPKGHSNTVLADIKALQAKQAK